MNDNLYGEGMPSHKNGSTGAPFSPAEYFDQRSSSSPSITVGAGLKRPHGKRIRLDEFSPQALKSILDAQLVQLDGWWSAHLWRGDYRAAKNWEAAIGVMIDVDYQASTENGHRKVILPPEWQDRLTKLAQDGRFAANIFHTTMHGFRLVYLLSERVENPQRFQEIARAAMNLAQLDIKALQLPESKIDRAGFVVDPISDDLARIMRRPNCYRSIEGGAREHVTGELVVIRDAPVSIAMILELGQLVTEEAVITDAPFEDEDIVEELYDSSVETEFPKEVLPPMILELMQSIATGCGVSFEMTLSAALALFCQAIGERIQVKVGPITGSPLLWFANIAPSGSAKSPIARYFLAPIKKRERELKKIYDVEYADYKAELAKRKSAKVKTDHAPIDIPARKRAYLTEATTEGLLQDLGNSDEPILYHVDEFPILLGSADGYGKSGSNLGRSRLLSLWGREMIAPSRRQNQEPLCDNPFLIIVAGAQPSVMRTLQLSRNDGLAARFLFVQPKPCFGGLGQELDESIPPEIESL
ncbi:MAG: DUF3987 domain-containing protein, partial [Planctomycetota bacterium]|nr:DUF3987 domain-containing protein [Planctomycetota bacterium]